jgi:hypothetical protein
METDDLEQYQRDANELGLELQLIGFDPWTVMGLALDSDGSTPVEFWRAELRRDGERVLYEVRDTASAAAEAAFSAYRAAKP